MLRSISPGRTPIAEYDNGVLWAALLLVTFGAVMVYSSSIAIAEASKFTGGSSTYFLQRHVLFLAAGAVAGMLAFQAPVRLWQQAAPWLFLLGVVLLVLLLVPGLGREVNGARRWLSFGFGGLQPSEFMKLFVVLYAADYTVRKLALMYSLKRGLLPMFAVMLVVGWLLLREPDFGAFVVVAAIATGVLFLGGMNGTWFAGLSRSRLPLSRHLRRRILRRLFRHRQACRHQLEPISIFLPRLKSRRNFTPETTPLASSPLMLRGKFPWAPMARKIAPYPSRKRSSSVRSPPMGALTLISTPRSVTPLTSSANISLGKRYSGIATESIPPTTGNASKTVTP